MRHQTAPSRILLQDANRFVVVRFISQIRL